MAEAVGGWGSARRELRGVGPAKGPSMLPAKQSRQSYAWTELSLQNFGRAVSGFFAPRRLRPLAFHSRPQLFQARHSEEVKLNEFHHAPARRLAGVTLHT